MDRPPTLCSALALVLFLLAPACGDSEAGGRLQIAVVPKGTQHEFWKSIHAGAERAAAELGVDIVWKGPTPEGDRDAQVRLVESFLVKGMAGIVLAPVDDRALVPVVEQAARQGVPTVVIDSGLQTGAKVAFVATDNRRGGELGAERLGELLGGEGQVILLRFQEGSASTMAREAGFLETLAARFPGIEVVSANQYGGDDEKAHNASQALLLAHPEVDGVFCPNESTTRGMLRALQESGRAGEVKFVGFDASEQFVRALQDGHLHGLVLQDPVDMGARGVQVMVAHLRGEPHAEVIHTNLVLATPANLDRPEVARLLHPEQAVRVR